MFLSYWPICMKYIQSNCVMIDNDLIKLQLTRFVTFVEVVVLVKVEILYFRRN